MDRMWSIKALLLSCFLCLGVEAQAVDLVWQYTTTNVSGSVMVERAPSQSGPFTVISTVSSSPSRFTLPAPDGLWYRVTNATGVSNVVQYTIPIVAGLSLEAPRIATLEAQLASICRAAKAMGGSPTSFAGRIRKEVPCL
jgi:hypothetical protein